MTGTRRDSGRKGGLTTLARYGREQLKEWGKLGGRRQREPNCDEMERQQQARARQTEQEVSLNPPGSLTGLGRLYELRQGSTATEVGEAGATQVTPRG